MHASSPTDPTITLGHPSYVWRAGQVRRLDMLQPWMPAQGQRVLDVGCGLGLYVSQFSALGMEAHGIDVDAERVAIAQRTNPLIRQGSAEALEYPDNYFQLVFSNEVLEHVDDDRQAVREAYRVLAPGGAMAMFVPNRLYPFETHGCYWRGTYHFGNIPLINWLPTPLRNRLAPHVRAYTRSQLRSLFAGLPGEIVAHRCVFAGYDNVMARHPRLGSCLRRLSYAAERTPLQWLGLSHLLVFRKAPEATTGEEVIR
ncbi:MAG: class I SAM-dependent methyltransferase [Anaerolineae bacterium]|jgi:SAM-dependent methyltransferase|nr:methyltransferase domain-containing protein [Chloroflexota bacterium]